jgi:hypothetical protein
MRAFRIVLVVAIGTLAMADSGVAPRSKSTDYPVHGNAQPPDGHVDIGAIIVPPDQVRKMFSGDIAQNYIVVEVAMYPESNSIDTSYYDFGLKIGDRFAHADSPADAALPWNEKGPETKSGSSPVHVTEDAGVVYSRSNDPYYGKRTGVGTYEGTSVSNGPQQAPAPSGPDRHAIEEKLRAKALPEGRTAKPVAGYLYFAQYSKKHKGDALELQYTKDGAELNLTLPAK